MKWIKTLYAIRARLVEAPAYLFYALFAWVYPTIVLRSKAASCPYANVRKLILRRSGISLGEQAEVNYGIVIVGRGRKPPAVSLGDRSAVGPYVCFVTSSYPDYSRLAERPDVQRTIKKFQPIRVEEDAWIGAGVTILPGIVIGRGAIVAAGAVVTKDVEPYTVVAGVPARVIRRLDQHSAS
jgi:maltose O-acetyltransferase